MEIIAAVGAAYAIVTAAMLWASLGIPVPRAPFGLRERWHPRARP